MGTLPPASPRSRRLERARTGSPRYPAGEALRDETAHGAAAGGSSPRPGSRPRLPTPHQGGEHPYQLFTQLTPARKAQAWSRSQFPLASSDVQLDILRVRLSLLFSGKPLTKGRGDSVGTGTPQK